MYSLEIASYTIIPLALFAIIIWLYYLLRKKNTESLTISPTTNQPKVMLQRPDTEKSPDNRKGQTRHTLHHIVNRPNKDETTFKSRNYKIRRLAKLTTKTTDIKGHLSKLRALPTAASRLRKISKKGSSEYLKMLMRKDAKPGQKQAKHALQRLSDIPDKRTKIINKLRKMHH